ncbi:MAG: hypothetical protein Q8922_00430 [Bacteroidota bacterium]|nr:hypothetical protein [Bacteroidota bacterium]MDP4232499.1 hypothetical protein [Bacteroidota bacterium]MDP4241635.1 hypothetical protein [Bacteroidota bacterium]MDP4286379.1 hypothetical protein [Bacteroidota bacterium]
MRRPAANALLSILLLAMALSGCMADRISEKMKSWVGRSEADLVQAWGPPTSVYKLDDGSKVLTYAYENDDASSRVDAFGVRRYSEATQRTRSFTIGPNGIVVRWRWQGY